MINIPNLKQSVNQLKKTLDNFKLNEAIDLCSNEAQTRKFLIEPFFEMLNYLPTDLIPEYNADFGDRVNQKIDYAILLNKKAGQLNGYFSNTKNSKIAILTNGIEYRFYSDVVNINIIDSKPFFIFNISDYSSTDLEALIMFDKRNIDIKGIVKTAQESVFIEDFETTFFKELSAPSNELLKVIHKNMTFKTKFNEETQQKMIGLINSTMLKTMYDKKVIQESSSNTIGIVTTESEIQAYHTIRTLLIQNKKIASNRIFYKDFKSFFNISIDDNTKKVICKLLFTDSKMKIQIENNEYVLEHLDDVIKYKNELTNRALALID
jgi:hypothetical protein